MRSLKMYICPNRVNGFAMRQKHSPAIAENQDSKFLCYLLLLVDVPATNCCISY